MDREQQPRGAAAALVQPDGAGPLWVVTTHLSHLSASDEQRGQARELVEWCNALRVEQDGCPLLLCGDMNSAPESSSQQRGLGAWHIITGHGVGGDELSSWSDCWETVHGTGAKGGLTCPSHSPRTRIDQFFLPTDLIESQQQVGGKCSASVQVVDMQ